MGIEIRTIETTIRKNKTLAAGIYKSLTLSETDFTTSLETIISKLLNKYKKINCYGGFQYDYEYELILDTFALSPLSTDSTLTLRIHMKIMKKL